MLCVVCCSVAQPCLTLCDPMDYIAHQAPLSMGFSRQEYWSGLPFPPPGDLPDPGVKTCVSCIRRQILYHQATREALCVFYCNLKIGKSNQSTWLFL